MSTEQAQLIDIQQIQQKPKINFCSPKLIILTVLSSYFVAQNIYHYMKNPKPQREIVMPEVDEWQQFWQMYDRFQGYIWVAIIGGIAWFYLRKYNDIKQQAEFQKEQQKRLLQQQKQRRLQSQRQERIIKKLQEEQRLQNQRQRNMNSNNKQENIVPNKEINEQEKQIKSDKKND